MINRRQITLREGINSGNLPLVAMAYFDALWDKAGHPDYHCSTIKDVRDNLGNIRKGRLIELPRAQYYPKDDSTFTLRDITGELSAQLYVDGQGIRNRAESWVQSQVGDPVRKKFKSLQPGSSIHMPTLELHDKGIYLVDFQVKEPSVLDRVPALAMV